MTVTLAFPQRSTAKAVDPDLVSGPFERTTDHPRVDQDTPNFRYLSKIVDYLNGTTSITQLTVNILTTSTAGRPFTMLELFHILPFYELEFLDWDVRYQPVGLRAPLEVHGWCMERVDAERDRFVLQRARLRDATAIAMYRGSNSSGQHTLQQHSNVMY